MKFSFSSNFRQQHYQQLLREIGAELDAYRLILGINVTEMMAALHVSHPVVKRY